MKLILLYSFLFFLGSSVGWCLELFYRRWAHGKWVNPGFLIGPYLPIYGFGLCAMHLIYSSFSSLGNSWLVILFMGFSMTLIELVGGEIFIKAGGVKLWDYSKEWGNFEGIICPLFSLIWIGGAAVYYYFLAPVVYDSLTWFTNNLSFSFVVGYFFGLITIDFAYSTNLLMKLRKYAKENDFVIRYEELKLNLKKLAEENKEKYSFIFAFKSKEPIISRLEKVFKDI